MIYSAKTTLSLSTFSAMKQKDLEGMHLVVLVKLKGDNAFKGYSINEEMKTEVVLYNGATELSPVGLVKSSTYSNLIELVQASNVDEVKYLRGEDKSVYISDTEIKLTKLAEAGFINDILRTENEIAIICLNKKYAYSNGSGFILIKDLSISNFDQAIMTLDGFNRFCNVLAKNYSKKDLARILGDYITSNIYLSKKSKDAFNESLAEFTKSKNDKEPKDIEALTSTIPPKYVEDIEKLLNNKMAANRKISKNLDEKKKMIKELRKSRQISDEKFNAEISTQKELLITMGVKKKAVEKLMDILKKKVRKNIQNV